MDNKDYYPGNPQKNYGRFLRSPFWKSVRQDAFNSYGKCCEVCGRSGKLNVHHVNYDTVKEKTVANLTVLCNRCHKTTHKLNGSTPNMTREVCLEQLKEHRSDNDNVKNEAAAKRKAFRDNHGISKREPVDTVPGKERAASRRETYRQSKEWKQ